MREAVKAARAFVKAPAWSDYIISEFGEFANATTDEALDAYIRNNTSTFDHPVGSVRMGQGPEGALNADLTVKGTVGLRVVDASAFVSVTFSLIRWPEFGIKSLMLSESLIAFHPFRAYTRSDVYLGRTGCGTCKG